MFFETLLLEIDLQIKYLQGESIETIYFGGGTPSLLSAKELSLIFDRLTKFHHIDKSCEITLEANPDDLDPGNIKELKKTPVNRLSIGIQSFFDDDLKYLHRTHSADDALKSVNRVKDNGYTNISIDLIYGIPTLTERNWQSNLNTFFSLGIPHLSAYALTIDSKSALEVLIRNRKALPVNEEEVIRQFNRTMKAMRANNYVHYEISNFCREGYISRHNTSYWSRKKYLGLGPSAHSFNGITRQWNVSNLTQYIDSIKNGIIPSESEFLSQEQHYNEYILTSLRTMWGIDLKWINTTFGDYYVSHFVKSVAKFLHNKSVKHSGGKYTLSDKGKLFADGIAVDLFI